MKNVYDIRYEKNLTYIIAENEDSSTQQLSSEVYLNSAIIIYLYYIDEISKYCQYIDNIPTGIDIFIISSREDVLTWVHKNIDLSLNRNIQYILKNNKGYDISALLIESKKIADRYKYVCFLHDKKEHMPELKDETELWVKNLWGNLIGSSSQINGVLNIFERNKNLGILSPPEPIGDHFCTWYGFGWHNSFEVTKKIADKMHLQADIKIDKPPITLGTALWFRSDALKKLFCVKWKYSDFNDNRLKDANYFSYGIERIFAYVAQDAGYDTGTVMTVDYARIQTSYIQYSIHTIFGEVKKYFPLATVSDIKSFQHNWKNIRKFVRSHQEFYLYGAGKMGIFALDILRREHMIPKAFIVSNKKEDLFIEDTPVYLVDEIENITTKAMIITVTNESALKEIIQNLKRIGIKKYIDFVGKIEGKDLKME